MKFNRIVLLALMLFSLPLQAVSADQIAAEKRASIERLLTVTNAMAMGRQFSKALTPQLVNMIKASHPEIPQKLLDIIPEEVDAVIGDNLPALKETMIQLYSKYFTTGEIKELADFYSSGVGQKAIKTMPMLMQESIVLGRQWGRALGPEIQQRLSKRFKENGITL